MHSTRAHLWAIGYDDLHRARKARDVVNELAGPQPYLILLETLVVIRSADGSYTFDREPHHTVANIATSAILCALVGWMLSVPALAAAVGALLACVGSAATRLALINKKFIEDVKALMKPGTCALFVLDDVGDIDVVLHRIKGLGGTVLKTNVDVEQLRLVQSALGSETARREFARVDASSADAVPRAEA